MTDLISREALIEHLRQFAPEHYNAIVNDVITKEPVAFDREKVRWQLIELRNAEIYKPDSIDRYIEARTQGRYSAFLEAISIVERGGIE